MSRLVIGAFLGSMLWGDTTCRAQTPAVPAATSEVDDPSIQLLRNNAMLERLRQGPMRKFKFADQPRPLPTVSFQTADGQRRSLANWRGSLVVLNIWASWCAPCREEMPSLQRLSKRAAGDGVRIVTVSIDKSADTALKFLQQIGAQELPLLIDPNLSEVKRLGVEGAPTTLVIDPFGRELGRIEGSVNWDKDEALLLVKSIAMKVGSAAR